MAKHGFGNVVDEEPIEHVSAVTTNHDRVVILSTIDDRLFRLAETDDRINLGIVLDSQLTSVIVDLFSPFPGGCLEIVFQRKPYHFAHH